MGHARVRVDPTGKYVVWVTPLVDILGTGEHTHTDQFDGLVRNTIGLRKARDRATMRVNARKQGRRLPKQHGRPRQPSPEPYLRAKVLRANVKCRNAVIVHVIDRVLFPDMLNLEMYRKAE